MRAAAPAPACTVTSSPSDLNFLTVSGVAATRVSPAAVSFRTASFIRERSGMGAENGEEHHQQQDPDQRPFGEAEEPGISAAVLADVHRAGFVIGMICHEMPLGSGRTIANAPCGAIASWRA